MSDKEKDSDSLRDTIIPKSDQLNYDDLIAGPVTVRVLDVTRADSEQPIAIKIDGGRQPFKPCKSMRRVLIKVWGEKGKDWVGKRMRLYADSDVIFGGVKVGGIRISHMSGISNPVKLLLTTTRSKRSEYVVQPLLDSEAKPYPAEKFETAFSAMRDVITSGKMTAEQVILKCEKTGTLNDSQRGRIMAAAGVIDNAGDEFTDDLPL